jgi:Na+-translocating ferredoxin:NAD+ oxidoreductase subunit A
MEPAVLLQIAIGAILINNFILARFLGLCPFFGVSKKLSSAIGMGISVVFVMSVATLFTWSIQKWVLAPFGVDFLRTIVFILVIASLVQLVEMALQKYVPALYEALGIFLPLITTNCAILGVAIINTELNPYTGGAFSLVEAVINAAASGMGFTLALVLMAGIRERLEFARIPKPLEGLPIAFVTAGLMALAFLGFSGFSFS